MKYQKWINLQLPRLDGKTVLITGANSGIGFEATRGFLALGAKVILACRSQKRAEAAIARLSAEFQGAAPCFLPLDLADFNSIDAFVETLGAKYQKIDVALHCAGVYYPNVPQTKQGHPTTVGVNFLGTAYLAERLLPLMDSTSRMIFTTSLVDRFGKEKALDRFVKHVIQCKWLHDFAFNDFGPETRCIHV